MEGRQPSICLIGNYNIDQLMGPLDRLPDWGVEYVVPTMTVRTGGAVGNTALALAALGESALCVGNVGDDAYGQMIRHELAGSGADVSGIITTLRLPTAVGLTLVQRDGQRAFVTYLGHLEAFDSTLIEAADAAIARAQYVLVAGYFLLPKLDPAELQRLMVRWRQRGQKVALDTGWDPEDWQGDRARQVHILLRHVDIFLPNYDEAKALTGVSDPLRMLRELRAEGPALVAIKLGPEGAVAADGHAVLHVEGHRVPVVDTCGAGDVFNAGILYGLSRMWPLDRLLAFANAQAALSLSGLPNRFPSLEQVNSLLTPNTTYVDRRVV